MLEFFFPIYSRLDVVLRLQEAIRDPAFDVDSTPQVDQLLDLIPRKTTRGLGSDDEQLRATIEHCVGLEELRQFIDTHQDRDTGLTLADSLADSARLAGATPVDTDARDNDLLKALVERIYKLRNRIVHAKDISASRELEEPIFPFSPEAHQLHPEVEVLRYLAEAVLEYSAAPR